MTGPGPWEEAADLRSVDADDSLLDAVRQDLDQLRTPARGHHNAPRVVCWPELSVHEAAAELQHLSEWISWLVGRYSLDHRAIPPCWHRHGALVEELCALHTLWQACFAAGASPADPANFHQHLNLALQRLRDWAARRDCKPGHHRDDQPPVWPPTADPGQGVTAVEALHNHEP